MCFKTQAVGALWRLILISKQENCHFLSTESRIFQHLTDATELVHSNYDKAMVFWFQKQRKHVWGSDLFRNTCGCFLFRQRDCCFFISTPRIVVSSPSWSRRIPYLGWVPSTKNWCSHRKLFLMFFWSGSDAVDRIAPETWYWEDWKPYMLPVK